jgi:hypothetical protein
VDVDQLSKIASEKRTSLIQGITKAQKEISQESIRGITMEDAFERAGGFGPFQWFIAFLMAILRNFGMPFVYLASLNTKPMNYLCTNDPEIELHYCSATQIC